MAASACERLPHPSLPLACWLWTSPLKTSLAPEDHPESQTKLALSKRLILTSKLSIYFGKLGPLAVGFLFPNTPCNHWLDRPFVSPWVWETSGVECEPVWCCRCSAVGCWSAVALPGHWSGAPARSERPCQAQGHASGIMVHWGDVSKQTHTARSRLLRLHYRGHNSHGMSGILGCEMRLSDLYM